MEREQEEEQKSEPVSLSMMNEDPVHLAGRLEEYETLSQNPPPNLSKFHEWDLKDKCTALIAELQTRPRLLRWHFNQVGAVLNPRWADAMYDARLERMFLDEPTLMPIQAAMRVIGTLRMPYKMKPFILKKAQRVKNRLEQRQRDQVKRELRQEM